MHPTKKLARVLTDEVDGGYRLTFEATDGEIFRMIATVDQLNDLADEIDDLLGGDDTGKLDEDQEHVSEEQPS